MDLMFHVEHSLGNEYFVILFYYLPTLLAED
jgi:hypothetical protein